MTYTSSIFQAVHYFGSRNNLCAIKLLEFFSSQIYYEKLEAHKKDQEMLQQEKEKKEKQVRRKRDEILSESAQKKHLDPNLSRLQVYRF